MEAELDLRTWVPKIDHFRIVQNRWMARPQNRQQVYSAQIEPTSAVVCPGFANADLDKQLRSAAANQNFNQATEGHLV